MEVVFGFVLASYKIARTELAAPVDGTGGDDDGGRDGGEVHEAALGLPELGEEPLGQVYRPKQVHLYLGVLGWGVEWYVL